MGTFQTSRRDRNLTFTRNFFLSFFAVIFVTVLFIQSGDAADPGISSNSDCSLTGKFYILDGSYSSQVPTIQNENDASAYHLRGMVYLGKKDYSHAIDDFSQAIRVDPGYLPSYKYRGLAYFSLGYYDKAIADYTTYLKTNSSDYVAYFNRGSAYSQIKEYNNAILDFTSAISLNPNDTFLYGVRAGAYTALGDMARANEDCTTISRIESENKRPAPSVTKAPFESYLSILSVAGLFFMFSQTKNKR